MNISHPTISVIIPTFNRQSAVIAALESVLAQSYSPTQIIIVDDGSTDDTARALAPYLSDTLSCVSLIPLDINHGVSFARNAGIKEATGEWIAFLDSDDTWHPQKLAQQVDFIAQNPAYQVVQTNEIWIRHGVRVNAPKSFAKYGGEIFERCVNQTMITTSSVLIHQSVFAEVGTFETTLPACEDYDLWLRISALYPIGLVEGQLITRFSGAGDQLSEIVPLLNKYRALALENTLQLSLLNDHQQALTRTALCKKLTMLYKGAKKRSLTNEEAEYATLLKKWNCPHA